MGSDECVAQNQGFNVVDSDIFHWKWMRSRLITHIGVEVITFADFFGTRSG
jgi:hypothetical protein